MLKACCNLGYCQTALCDVVLEGTVFSDTLFQKDSLSPALYLVFYDIIIILPQDMYMGVVVAVEAWNAWPLTFVTWGQYCSSDVWTPHPAEMTNCFKLLQAACSLTTKFLLQYQMFFIYIMCRSHIKGVTNMDKTTCSNELLSHLNVYFVLFTGSYIPFIGLIS